MFRVALHFPKIHYTADPESASRSIDDTATTHPRSSGPSQPRSSAGRNRRRHTMVSRGRHSLWDSTTSMASIPWTNPTIQSLPPAGSIDTPGVSIMLG
jgi:hypothetical protein